MEPPNGLGISGGALLDREGYRADSNLQNGYNLAGAKRRPLHALVRHRLSVAHDQRLDAFILTLTASMCGMETLLEVAV